jgi:hypothetical protein
LASASVSAEGLEVSAEVSVELELAPCTWRRTSATTGTARWYHLLAHWNCGTRQLYDSGA